jgi:hypothetical protein
MKSATLGHSTSQVEVTNVSPHGFWLFVDVGLLTSVSETWVRQRTHESARQDLRL